MTYTSVEIGFPGLGIDSFIVDRAAFSVGGHPVMWYGIIIAIGMMVAVGYVMFRTRCYKGIIADDVLDFAIFVVLFGVIGARLYYVLTSGHNYSFGEIFAIWEGGLAIYGGIIFGAATAVAVCLVKKIRPQCFCDMLAPAVMIAQAIGRWGNFMNGEAHGGETASFLRMELSHLYENGVSQYIGAVHPTFLYESLWNLLGFILINIFYNKRKFDGQITLTYFAWYGFGRMFIEGLRTDSLYVGPFRISQVVGLLSFLISTAALIYFLKKGKRYASASYKDEPKEKGLFARIFGETAVTEESVEDTESDDDYVPIADGEKDAKKDENNG